MEAPVEARMEAPVEAHVAPVEASVEARMEAPVEAPVAPVEAPASFFSREISLGLFEPIAKDQPVWSALFPPHESRLVRPRSQLSSVLPTCCFSTSTPPSVLRSANRSARGISPGSCPAIPPRRPQPHRLRGAAVHLLSSRRFLPHRSLLPIPRSTFFPFLEKRKKGGFKGPLTQVLMMATANGAARASAAKPLFTFGVIADVQYADIPDGRSFLGVPRYYRHSISVLQRAVGAWNKQGGIKFSINFGDIVDGFCPKDKSLWAVQKVIDEFEKFDGPTYHMFGNHCLYNLPRSKLLSLLKMPTGSDRAYYEFSPCPEYRFVVLDAYDFSTLGWPRDHPVTAEAMKLLDERNPNTDKNSPDGLVGVDRRFVMFNGAVGKDQLSWLDDVLKDASDRRQNVILCSHLPMDPGAASPVGLMWNYDEVMAIVRQYNCVKACFAGHDHKGGHSVDSHGVHHRTLEAALECPPGTSAFGHIEAYPDRLLLVGSDGMANTEMCFQFPERALL